MPRLTLQSKAFLALSILLVVLLALFMGFSRLGLQRGLGPYVAEIELGRLDWLAGRLERVYVLHGGWQPLRTQPELWRQMHKPEDALPRAVFGPTPPPKPGDPGAPSGRQGARNAPATCDAYASGDGSLPSPPRPDPGGGGPPPGEPPEHALSVRLGLIDSDRQLVAGVRPVPGTARRVLRGPRGEAIGQLVLLPPLDVETEADQAFLREQLVFVAWTGAAGLILALWLSWWLARRWLAPIGALVHGARRVAGGRLDTRVPVQGDDELARLASTFNDMAEQLANMEASRRQWIGDVAHELRTPLAAMRAEIEAVQDGVRTFDDRTALRLHRQVMRLIQLVGDLRASLDAAGEATPTAPEPVEPLPLLSEAVASMQARFDNAGIALDTSAVDACAGSHPPPVVRGDPAQLHRVYLNLLENSLRYTETGGRLCIAARTERKAGNGAWLVLQWDDTAPGVPAPELPRVFDRLYRAEASRTRAAGDTGGSGLGLAICRAIVQAHGGRITAEASPLGGLRILLTLPLLETPIHER
ncbi:ATP-binding protein [Acidovorax sp. NCPPB 3859]|nr:MULTISPECIES: ATP-binding protein [unclassified Acidovorax]MDA8452660.1 ATP-binding protein [Acidovorax sp. GBBC 3297]MDA8462067.1 ATP-binding protein [Acidovorax sp. GBBC 3333]MDA8467100.1 ATP-binding protein [Acidovorax sp. GBBC 3332]MDA8472136.1 ATP-binding protein [Acidovorax sp. GBBC 3299]WCM80196.1 ATP-binding protein [Acidovorax sp. GBBC 712]